jgi:hypothetical protein
VLDTIPPSAGDAELALGGDYEDHSRDARYRCIRSLSHRRFPSLLALRLFTSTQIVSRLFPDVHSFLVVRRGRWKTRVV